MKNEQKPNYQILFIMGITFTGAGVAIGTGTGMPVLMVGLAGMGAILMAIGLAKRDQWPDKKNQDGDI
jgi:hypothetical protein